MKEKVNPYRTEAAKLAALFSENEEITAVLMERAIQIVSTRHAYFGGSRSDYGILLDFNAGIINQHLTTVVAELITGKYSEIPTTWKLVDDVQLGLLLMAVTLDIGTFEALAFVHIGESGIRSSYFDDRVKILKRFKAKLEKILVSK